MSKSTLKPSFQKKHHLRALFRSLSFVTLLLGFCAFNLTGNYNDLNQKSAALTANVNLDADMMPISRRLDEEAVAQSCDDVVVADSRWQLFFYIAGVLYTFLALAVVCDELFVPALEEMSSPRHLNLSMDVAGATLMAAGGSAPELFTAFFGTFAESEVGFGTVVGSAVFNVLFVVGMCSFFSKDLLTLTWWPLFRDSLYYVVSLCVLAVFIAVVSPGEVELWEAGVLFAMYLVYVLIMSNNEALYNYVSRGKKGRESKKTPDSDFVLVDGEQIGNAISLRGDKGGKCDEEAGPVKAIVAEQSEFQASYDFRWHGTFRAGVLKLITDPKSWTNTAGIGLVSRIQGNVDEVFRHCDKNGDEAVNKTEMRKVFEELGCNINDEEFEQVFSLLDTDGDGMIDEDEFTAWYVSSEQRMLAKIDYVFKQLDVDNSGSLCRHEITALLQSIDPGATEDEVTAALQEMYQTGDLEKVSFKEFSDWYTDSLVFQRQKEEAQEATQGIFASLRPPKGDDSGFWAYIQYVILLPLVFTLAITVPDVRRPGLGKYCYVSFLLAIAWIGVYSYFMVDWATIIGATFGIPDVIMGLTFLAAGTSVPDLLSSVIVARMGEGDMAVSSSLGSNIFDILVGLPIPWIAYTAYPGKPSTVSVGAEGVGLSICILIAMIILVISTIHFSGWKLTKCAGVMMFVFYFMFLTQAVWRALPFETCV